MKAVVYYRVSDGKVMGSTSAVLKENGEYGKIDIQFELKSWGPGIAALEVSDDSPQVGKIRKVVNGSLIHEDDPSYVDLIQNKRRLWDKVKMRLLLTNEEMELFMGRRP